MGYGRDVGCGMATCRLLVFVRQMSLPLSPEHTFRLGNSEDQLRHRFRRHLNLIIFLKSYNCALKKARVRVEQAFWMLKKRFPAILYQVRSRKIEIIQAIMHV